jgi:Required for nuclear transport of RNA pol II C-terminus 1
MATAENEHLDSNRLNRLFAGLTALVTPPDRDKCFKSVDSSLQINISEATVALGHETLADCLDPLVQACGALPDDDVDDTAWHFTCACLSLLVQLNELLKNDLMLSVQQKGLIKSGVQFVSALGVGPLLQPGVGVPLESRCNAPVTFPKNSPPKLAYLTKCLLFLTETRHTEIHLCVANNLLLDILASLFQLSQDDKEFKFAANKFVRSMHQPTVMRHLMMLLKPDPKTPRWFLVTTSSYLNKCLMAPGGVISTVRALHDVDCEQGQIDKFSKTAKIILQPTMAKNPEYYAKLCPQVTELLNSNSDEYKQVAAEIIQLLHSKDNDFCRENIFVPICKVFDQDFGDLEGNLVLAEEQEKSLTASLQKLLLLISHSKISPDCISKHFSHICAFALAIRKTGATPALREHTKELISKIVVEAEDAHIWHTITTLPEEYLESLSEDSAVAHSLFANFLKRFSVVEDLQEKLLLNSLLGALAGLQSVQNEFMANPSDQMIDLLKNLLESGDPEIIHLALLLLMAIISQNENNLRKCQVLLPAVKKLRDDKVGSSEIQTLVEQIFTIIATFGAVCGDTLLVEEKLSQLFKQKSKIEELPPTPTTKPILRAGPATLTFEEALAEAVDPEIPVQGHGYLSLTKLLRQKCAEAKSKAETLWELGLVGLHNDDSYVYLAAVGMMSALVLENLHFLCKLALSYNQRDLSLAVRNRIGEALLQVCKGLGKNNNIEIALVFLLLKS